MARLTKVVAVESAVDEKRDIHLSIHGKHDPAGRNRGNSRNGARSKTLLTEPGPVEIEVPLHRKSSVEPRIVTKRQWWLSGVDDLVISLSARYSQCGLRPQKLK